MDLSSLFISLFSISILIISAILLTSIFKPISLTEAGLITFVMASGQIVLVGYIVSKFNQFDSLSFWFLVQVVIFALLLILIIIVQNLRKSLFTQLKVLADIPNKLKVIFNEENPRERFLIRLVLLSLLLLGLINLFVVYRLPPHDWDSMEYHLARVAYYLQQGNLSYFDANFWAQVVHPKNSVNLVTYVYLLTGRNENLTQIVEFAAYWASVLGIYGIARTIGLTKGQSLFSAGIFGLLTECLLQATTTENDMLIAAYSGAAVFFILRSKSSGRIHGLIIAGISIGLACGVKASFLLVLPSLGIIFAYIIFIKTYPPRLILRKTALFGTALIMSLFIFVMPSGYWDNLQRFGHPLAPDSIRLEHTFEGQATEIILAEGGKNILRYSLDFISLDGLYWNPLTKFQLEIKKILSIPLEKMGLNLESTENVRAPFSYNREPSSHESVAYWGILGVALVWVVVFFSLFKSGLNKERQILAFASLIFLLVQAFASPYDPWRGRYFLTAAIFATPLSGVALLYTEKKLVFIYLLIVVVLGTLSGFSTLLVRANRSLIDYRFNTGSEIIIVPSVLKGDRLEQLSSERGKFYEVIKNFEEHVPADATVAVLFSRFYEYPFFGEKLTRRLIPVNSFWSGKQEIPPEATYLIFDSTLMEPETTDILLGSPRFAGDIYLRHLDW